MLPQVSGPYLEQEMAHNHMEEEDVHRPPSPPRGPHGKRRRLGSETENLDELAFSYGPPVMTPATASVKAKENSPRPRPVKKRHHEKSERGRSHHKKEKQTNTKKYRS